MVWFKPDIVRTGNNRIISPKLLYSPVPLVHLLDVRSCIVGLRM